MPVADLRMEEQDPAGIRPIFPQFVSVLRTMWEPEAWHWTVPGHVTIRPGVYLHMNAQDSITVENVHIYNCISSLPSAHIPI